MIMIILSGYTPDEEAEDAEAAAVERRRRVALCSPLRLLAFCLPEQRRRQQESHQKV